MFERIVSRIRRRSRSDYEEAVFARITDVRIWVQENAERAALVFLGVGFLIPFFFKPLLFVLAVLVLAGFTIWTIAGVAPADAGQAEATGDTSPADRPPPQPFASSDPSQPNL
jgi:hypothetical protein